MNISLPKLTSLAIISLISINAIAQDYVWIIGGGPYLKHSQSQIELNVKWAIKTVENKNSQSIIRVFFTDGKNPAPDVMAYININDKYKHISPLDYIYGGSEANLKRYTNKSIDYVIGSTQADELKKLLSKELKKLKVNDTILIIYNGHGGHHDSVPNSNYLRLWNNTRLTVYEFEKILSKINPSIPTRFIMTQCYSGAFGNSIYKDANAETKKPYAKRCGFMAEAYNRESEGCSGSLIIDDYRDYSTYFFAALNGKTRLNKELSSNPDLNNNNEVSLYEAHLYTLENAYSTDLSRSTSEQYLETWEPWYLRWLGRPDNIEQSIYYKLAKKIALKNHIPKESYSNIRFLAEKRETLKNKFDTMYSKDKNLKARIKSVQKEIATRLESTYPDINDVYYNLTPKTYELTIEKLNNIIVTHKNYPALVPLFKQRDKLLTPLLDTERKLTQIEKIIRMLKLAKLDMNFKAHASSEDKEIYNNLLTCENSTL